MKYFDAWKQTNKIEYMSRDNCITLPNSYVSET